MPSSYLGLLRNRLDVTRVPCIFEYYSSETGQPSVMAADTFGWTAAVFVDLAIQASQEENNG